MHSSIHADHVLRSLALAVARNQVGAMRPVQEILASEGLTQAEYDSISTNPQFQRYRDAYATELRDNGFSFAAKCKVLAEDLLPNMYHLARDPDVPAAVKAKIHENLVEWAELKPKNNVQATAGPGFSITINLPRAEAVAAPTEVIENSPSMAVQTPTLLPFEEPEDYEYAGDDYL